MKTILKMAFCAIALLTSTSRLYAAITGQWDFDKDLSATIGQPISFLENDTETNTRFGTTTSFGIANINGQEAKVMLFPKTIPAGGYSVPTGAQGNGNGFLVNQFTVIMDIYFPAASSDKLRALMETDFQGDSDYRVGPNNGIGAGGSFDGNLTPDTWHRIAFGVDLAANPTVIDKYIDGVKVGSQTGGNLDGGLALSDSFYLFSDDNDEVESGYINSLQIQDTKLTDGLIAALGGPNAAGILTGPPPNPYIASSYPSSDTARIPTRSTVPPQPEIKIVIEDGVSKVAPATIQLKFDSNTVTPTVTQNGSQTTVTYTPPALLEALSIHDVALTFQDNATPANSLGTQFKFAIGPFSPLNVQPFPSNTANTPGFRIKTVQAFPYIAEVGNATNLPQTVQRAIQQINGTLRDINGNLIDDQSVAGENTDGSYGWPDTINFSTSLDDAGNFPGDSQFPGIPGTDPESGNQHSTQFTSEVLTFLDLKQGVHRIGITVNISRVDVNDDDGYTLFVGQNPRDVFSDVVGSYTRNSPLNFPENAQSSNEFTFYAPADGLYPFRLLFYQAGREASLEWWSVDLDSGEKILINDPSNPNAIKAYQNSTSPLAHLPYIAELSPRPGTLGNKASEPVQILIDDDRTKLDTSKLQLSFDGLNVTPNVTTTVPSTKITDKRTVVSYQPNLTRIDSTSDLHLAYADNASPANQFTRDWSFTIALERGASTIVRGQWDFDNGNLAATVGRALEYFDGPGGDTQTKTQFGTTTSFGVADIDGKPANVMRVPGDLSNKIGYKMFHGITPNGGGTKVNQYTLIYDVMIAPAGPGAASMIQIDDLNNTSDGDLFWQGNNFGQGAGGYNGTSIFTPDSWHRVVISVDLTTNPGLISKFVDGVKQDDWKPGDRLDGRRALQEYAILFADGDQDERRVWYVNSIQVREGKMSDAEVVSLGKPSSSGVPGEVPATNVTGQWDFDAGNLSATVGRALEYFDGADGDTKNKTEFGTASSFGIANIDGQDVKVMKVPGDLSNKIGYKMFHGISPNGGGTKVNQYTLIYDVMIAPAGPGAASMIQIDDLNNTSDGDLFWQGNNFGQGANGYNGTSIFTPDAWHRVAIAVDLTQNPGVISKFVDGVKQDDWKPGDRLDGRRALQDYAILFADGDQDERRVWYVNSIQVRDGKLSDAQMVALGKPGATGIPLATPQTTVMGQWDFDAGNLAAG